METRQLARVVLVLPQVPKVHREFSMGVASVADSSGIVAAGVASIFIHSYVCNKTAHMITWHMETGIYCLSLFCY